MVIKLSPPSHASLGFKQNLAPLQERVFFSWVFHSVTLFHTQQFFVLFFASCNHIFFTPPPNSTDCVMLGSIERWRKSLIYRIGTEYQISMAWNGSKRRSISASDICVVEREAVLRGGGVGLQPFGKIGNIGISRFYRTDAIIVRLIYTLFVVHIYPNCSARRPICTHICRRIHLSLHKFSIFFFVSNFVFTHSPMSEESFRLTSSLSMYFTNTELRYGCGAVARLSPVRSTNVKRNIRIR